MGVDDEPNSHGKSSKTLEKWSQQATTSAFGFVESLRGQGSSLAKNLKSFGKTLMKDGSTAEQTPHDDKDVRLTWLTDRLALADTSHLSPKEVFEAEKLLVKEMADCQPYVVVNVNAEILKLDGYAKAVQVPIGSGSRDNFLNPPSIRSLFPIMNEYSLLTNDAAIVFFGLDANAILAAAFCVIASRSIDDKQRFLNDALPGRFEALPPTYKKFLEQTSDVVDKCFSGDSSSVCATIQRIVIEPGSVIIEGELYVSITSCSNQMKLYEFSAGSARTRQGTIVFDVGGFEAVDDVIISLGHRDNSRPMNEWKSMMTGRFNTQLLDPDDTEFGIGEDDLDLSPLIPRPARNLKMVIQFATRREPSTANNFNFPRYRLFCVRNEKELDRLQSTYGSPKKVTETRRNVKEARKADATTKGPSASFFDTLEYDDHQESLLVDDLDSTHNTADLLGAFTVNDEPTPRVANTTDSSSRDFGLSGQASIVAETPILTAPTPSNSSYDQQASKPSFFQPQATTAAIDDLLGLDSEPTTTATTTSKTNSSSNIADFDFGAPLNPTKTAKATNPKAANDWQNDLLGGFSPMRPAATATPPNSMVNSATNSKPVSQVNSQSDFEAFLANYPEPNRASPNLVAGNGQPQARPAPKVQPPVYKPAFGDPTPAAPKISSDAFSDLFQGGFKPTIRDNQKQTIGSLLNAQQAVNLTPEEIKIRDWTAGKERNIRALLGSLNDVLWDGADKWNQPTMGDLLTPNQVKKHYRKACLVVHPDKLTGSVNEPLARAIFTELNDAYGKYTADTP